MHDLTLTLMYAVYVIGKLAALLLFSGLSDRVGRRLIGLAALALGNSMSVIGVGLIAAQWSPIIAGISFASTIGLFAIGAIITGLRYGSVRAS